MRTVETPNFNYCIYLTLKGIWIGTIGIEKMSDAKKVFNRLKTYDLADKGRIMTIDRTLIKEIS